MMTWLCAVISMGAASAEGKMILYIERVFVRAGHDSVYVENSVTVLKVQSNGKVGVGTSGACVMF